MAAPIESLVERLGAAALRAGPDPIVDATAVAKFAQSPFALWCDHFAPPSAKDAPDEFLQLLFEQGREHEARVLAARAPKAKPLAYETPEEGFRLALREMAAGAAAIRGPPLFFLPEGLKGRADLLERVDGGASVFGTYHYEVREIKLARNLADHHRLQAAFYNHLLGRIQGFTPSGFAILNRDLEETRFGYDEPELLATLRAVRDIQRGAKPDPVHKTGIWPWETYTDQCARDARDVSLVAGIGPSIRARLVGAGFRTVEDVAAAEPTALTAIKGVGKTKAAAFRTNAQALVRGTHIPIGRVAFEPRATEIFLDLEGTGAQTSSDGLIELDYLIGVLVRRDGRETYRAFVAHSFEDEGRMFREFLDWLATQRDYALYHWHNYEATHLRKLAERHGLDDARRDALLAALRDLHKDATRAFAFPTYDLSIKSIAPYMGFSWRHRDVNAMASIALYFDYVRDPAANQAKLQKVIDYNQDDCVAMRVVKDWLVQNAAATVPARAPGSPADEPFNDRSG